VSAPPLHTPQTERPAPRLYRSRDDRVIGGVSAGIAQYLGTDPVVVRLVFVVLALVGGGGLLAYLIAWVIVPEEPAAEDLPPGTPAGHGATRATGSDPSLLAGLVLVVMGAALLVHRLVPGFSWRFAGPVLLVALGVLLVGRGRAER
jgi:phage shock protein C